MGRTHGSMARAGKVKSQTIKVEPTKKRKKKTGRAKKRLLYNRRFIQITTNLGKRTKRGEGPNSQKIK